jgi:hypothetical protein
MERDFIEVNNRKARRDPTGVRDGGSLPVGVLLERRRAAQRQNHHRKFVDGMFATPRKHPDDDEETQKDQSSEKIFPMFVNQGVQESGYTGDFEHRMFHTGPSQIFWLNA